MARVARVSAFAALALAALSFSASAPALTASTAEPAAAPALSGAAAATVTGALASEGARQAAVDACVAKNEFGAVGVVEAVTDGMGDWLVWLKDRDGDLWSCNADAQGLVYMNVFVSGDMLEGHGSEFVPQQAKQAAAGAQSRAQDLCVGVAGLTQEVGVVATAADGLGDTLVWLRLADGQLWLCNASADAELYVFEPVGFPIGADDAGPVLSAEASED